MTDLAPSVGDTVDELDGLAAELVDAGGVAIACRGDVSSEADCAAIVSEVAEQLGPLTILVNNAGAPHGADRALLTDVPLDAWQRQLDVNLTGQFLMVRAVSPHLVEQGYGRVVNIASAAALIGGRNRTAYSASKAGILGFTRAAAAELAPHKSTDNAVCPGAIETSRADGAAVRNADAIPVGRFGPPADIAAAVAYLASPDAGYVTGQVLVVDGGATTLRV